MTDDMLLPLSWVAVHSPDLLLGTYEPAPESPDVQAEPSPTVAAQWCQHASRVLYGPHHDQ